MSARTSGFNALKLYCEEAGLEGFELLDQRGAKMSEQDGEERCERFLKERMFK
jgi:hypothetical protein